MLTIFKRLLFCLPFMFCISADAQDLQENLDSFAGKFISTIKNQEKAQAYLVTDKSIFKPGENVWFRGFLLNAISQKINTKHKYLFVDLVDDKDSVVSKVLLHAANQQLSGQIMLPANTLPGYYWLRAYTKQMAEVDTNNIFVKLIYVIGKDIKTATRQGAPTADVENNIPVMKFFPEGGGIMTGANSTVAFLIRDTKQRPVITEGFIKDSRDTIVAYFTSNKFGLGKFDLFASSARKYKAYIRWNGKEISYPLPSFDLRAGQIAVKKQAEGKIILRVLLEDSIYKKDLETYVIGVSKDKLCFAGIGRGLYEFEVSEEKFPEGIATFYLFDNNLKYLSERSIYVKDNNVIVKTSVNKNVYGKREKVTFSVSINDALNNPLQALYSVAAIDSAFSNSYDDCIVPDLADSRSINNIAIAHMQCLAQGDVDLIMLLKNNTLNDMSRNLNIPSSGIDSSLLFIKGKAMDEKNNPVSNKILILFSNTGNQIFVTDTTDNAGRFSFPVSDYVDSTQFVIEARNDNNKSLKVKLIRDTFLFPHLSTPVTLKRYFSADPVFTNKYRRAYLDTIFTETHKRLSVVSITAKKEANYDVSKRVNSSSVIVTANQLDERMSVGNIILNVGGLHMLNGFLVINGPTAMQAPDAGSEPLLLINGVQTVSSGSPGQSPVIETLNTLNPNDIDFIEILKGPEASNYGVRGGNGVILVNMAGTRRVKENRSGNNLHTFYARGISTSSLFPMIDYDNKAIKSAESPDNRSTIFWDGSVLNGTNEHVNFSFFSNDIPTTYRITISGITVHGDIIYKTLTIHSK